MNYSVVRNCFSRFGDFDFEDEEYEQGPLPTTITPEMHDTDYLQIAMEEKLAGDQEIEWLVQVAKSPVTAYALEIACRNDWWRRTLPILLKSENIQLVDSINFHAPADVVVLKYSILHPEQLAVIPQQFADAGLQLRMRPMSWFATAACAAFSGIDEAEMTVVRAELERLVPDDRFDRVFDRWTVGDSVSVSKTHAHYQRPKAEKTVDLQGHVDWMNSVLRGKPNIVL